MDKIAFQQDKASISGRLKLLNAVLEGHKLNYVYIFQVGVLK